MKSTTLFSTLAVAVLSVNALPPIKRDAAVDDTTVLNFALTLEHLESSFYQGALQAYDAKAFAAAGFPAWVRNRFQQIGEHEKTHVAFLSKALGDKATKPCEYKFPYTDPKSFVAVSQILEGVGVSAYTGAAQFITDKTYLTAAASVLATEARHASWVAAAANKGSGWSSAFDIPLGLNQVYSLAAPFITSCPSTNPQLPVRAFPTLSLTPSKKGESLAAATSLKVKYTSDNKEPAFIAFYTGFTQVFAPIKDGKVAIPSGLTGTVYTLVSTIGNGTVTDATTLAGPAVLEFKFKSDGTKV